MGENSDLDFILDMIKESNIENDLFGNEIKSAVTVTSQANITSLPCLSCRKSFKSIGGLTRHINSKHTKEKTQSVLIDNIKIKELVVRATGKLAEDDCFTSEDRSYFENLVLSDEEFLLICKLYGEEIKNFHGNAEKFHTSLHRKYEEISVSSLPKQLCYVLLSELTNCCLNYLIGGGEGECSERPNDVVVLSNKDVHFLEYIAGYCFRNLYCRIRKEQRKNEDTISDQWLAIIYAAKTQEDQQLVDSRNRGGLWKVNKLVVGILIEGEKIFRKYVSVFRSEIDSKLLTRDIGNNATVKSSFSQLCDFPEIEIDKEIGKNLLHHILMLFIWIRSHSYAIRLKEMYKAKKGNTKQKALHTALKKSTSTLDQGH